MPKTAPITSVIGFLDHELIKFWLQNTTSLNSRAAKRADLVEFIFWFKISSVDDFKSIERGDIMNWRDSMIKTSEKQGYATRSIKRKLSTISKFFEYLCDQGFVQTNVVLGVERPKLTANEGATQSISDRQAKELLEAPDPKTIKGKRDRAILATFLFHALRRSELCNLKIKDILERDGIKQLKVLGKGDKERYVPLHPVAIKRIYEYLEASGPQHAGNRESAIFRALSNNKKYSTKGMSPIAVYEIVIHYGQKIGLDTSRFSPHSLRATAATNTLVNGEDIRKVQHWLGHASIQTTAMYDKRDHRAEDSPTFRVRY
jgi:integrase/recombinase XerD